MPTFRKLSPAEIAELEHCPADVRAEIARMYDAYLADFAVGDYGRAELVDGDRRTLVRRRLQAAAGKRGLVLLFRSGPGPLTFQVAEVPTMSSSLGPVPVAAARPARSAPVPTPMAGVDQPKEGAVRREQMPPRPSRRRPTAAEPYHEMLPRWMRTGDAAGIRQGRRRNDNKRRTR